MLAQILSFFFGGGLQSIEASLVDAYKAKLTAANDGDRMVADENIAALQARRDILVAEQAGRFGWITPIIRGLFALGPLVYYSKIFIWDKAFALGTTDPLSDDLTWTARTIIAFFFVFEAVKAAKQ